MNIASLFVHLLTSISIHTHFFRYSILKSATETILQVILPIVSLPFRTFRRASRAQTRAYLAMKSLFGKLKKNCARSFVCKTFIIVVVVATTSGDFLYCFSLTLFLSNKLNAMNMKGNAGKVECWSQHEHLIKRVLFHVAFDLILLRWWNLSFA